MNLLTAAAYALDPVIWANSLGFEPDPWQEIVLRSTRKQILLLCSRQSGKSTTTALIGLHQALFVPGSLVLLLSPSQRQSGELYRRVIDFYSGSGSGSVGSTSETKRTLELKNGSRIVSLPGTEQTIRGYSNVDLLICDEASRIHDDLYTAVRPMLAVSGGRLVVLSTPFGKRGFFWDIWNRSSPSWLFVRVTADQCPRISPDFLAEELDALGTFWYDQEYGVVFQELISSVFLSEDIEAAFTHLVEPLVFTNPTEEVKSQ